MLGSVLDAPRAAELAHSVGAKLLLDGCQAAPRLPVFVDEQIVAGIGCSSGSPDQDEVVAQAGIDALLASVT